MTAPDRPRAVLWDMDGTLIDSEPLHRQTLRDVLLAVGCDAPPGLDAMLIGMSIDEVHTILRARLRLPLSLEAFARRRAVRYLELVSDLQPRHGALDIVAAVAAAAIPQAIVSNSERSIVDLNVAATRFDRFGFRTVSRDDVMKPKPDPEPYLLGAALLRVPIAACVVVEDSPTGARAGLAAGARVLAWPAPEFDLAFDAGITVIRSAAELRAALGF